MAGKNPIKFTDTTFRDGHQSLLATRMRTEDIVPFMERMDQMGYWAIEVWGGATFDTTHRFLGDDPWERIRTIKGILKKTPTMMLLRGQNLVGYRNYADDLTYRFVRYTAEAGVDIFRVFDALNDMRNWEVSVKALMDAKKAGLMAHFQAAVCYSLTQRRLGGPIFNLDYYVDFAKKSEEMGADSFVLKDMAGMVSPNDAYEIIKAIKETIKIPVEFHTHYTSGSGSMSYLKAIEAGVDVLDTCLCPFALRTSQPAIEPLLVAVEQTERETDMDLAKLIEIGQDLEKVAVKYRDLLDTSKMAQIDTGVLLHQIPGGMYSNLVNQLREANALDRIHEVMADLPQTRKDLGYPPLVTPTSQIVGIQAVMNVLFGRYKMVPAGSQGPGLRPLRQDPGAHGQEGAEDHPQGLRAGRRAHHQAARRDPGARMGQGGGRDQGPGQERRRRPDLRPLSHHRQPLPQVEVRPGARARRGQAQDPGAGEAGGHGLHHHQGQEALRQGEGVSRQPGKDRPGQGRRSADLQRLRGRPVLRSRGGVHLRGPGDHRRGARGR